MTSSLQLSSKLLPMAFEPPQDRSGHRDDIRGHRNRSRRCMIVFIRCDSRVLATDFFLNN